MAPHVRCVKQALWRCKCSAGMGLFRGWLRRTAPPNPTKPRLITIKTLRNAFNARLIRARCRPKCALSGSAGVRKSSCSSGCSMNSAMDAGAVPATSAKKRKMILINAVKRTIWPTNALVSPQRVHRLPDKPVCGLLRAFGARWPLMQRWSCASTLRRLICIFMEPSAALYRAGVNLIFGPRAAIGAAANLIAALASIPPEWLLMDLTDMESLLTLAANDVDPSDDSRLGGNWSGDDSTVAVNSNSSGDSSVDDQAA